MIDLNELHFMIISDKTYRFTGEMTDFHMDQITDINDKEITLISQYTGSNKDEVKEEVDKYVEEVKEYLVNKFNVSFK